VLTYATIDDLEAWVQADVPDNADLLIRSASMLVRRATASSYYDADTAGKPSDVDIAQAFSDATCAQVACWIALDINPAGGAAGAVGVTGAVTRSQLLSGEVMYDTAAQTGAAVVAAKMATVDDLCSESVEILRQAELLGSGVWTYG
jgi:hypothetical protein